MLTDDDLDNLRDLAKRQSANHAEKKILAAVAEIVRLNDLLRLALASSQRSRDELHARDKEIERLRDEEVRLTREVGKLRLLLCEWLGDEPGPPGESLVSRSREAVGDVGQ